MAPARRARRRHSRQAALDDSEKQVTPGAPSSEVWDTMEPYSSFVVRDQDDEEHPFKQGDVVIILPHGVPLLQAHKHPLHKHWVAKIKEIRSYDNDTTEVWIRVQWYWSGEDINCLIKSIDATSFGMYERVLSDQYDLVHSSCISGLESVFTYDEDDLLQTNIDEDTFFTRGSTIEYRQRFLEPRPKATCFCEQPYNPDFDTMHICARPSCRSAYHNRCLVRRNHVEPPSTTRPIRLLTSSPDTDKTFFLTQITPPVDPSTRTCPLSEVEILAAFPPELVRIAEQPIVKGFEVMSVVGNVRAVVQARRIIYRAVGCLKPMPDDWEQIIDGTVYDASVPSNMPRFPSVGPVSSLSVAIGSCLCSFALHRIDVLSIPML